MQAHTCIHAHTLSSGMKQVSLLTQSFLSFAGCRTHRLWLVCVPAKQWSPAILYGSIWRVFFWILEKYHIYIFHLAKTNAHWKRHCLHLYSGNKELNWIQSPVHNSGQWGGLSKAIQSQTEISNVHSNCTLAVPSYSAPKWTLLFFEPHSREFFIPLLYSNHWQQRHSFNWTAQDDCKLQFESVQDPSETLLLSGMSHWN